MDYKEHLYNNYRSTHNLYLYGEISLDKIISNFPVNDFFYGKLLPTNKNAKILEIGCGDGNFVYYLHERGYHKAFGIDISHEQIETGKNLGINNIELADLNIYLKDQDERFDCIIARDVIEHLTKQEVFNVLNRICDSLKAGGIFIMQVPNGQGLFYTTIFYGDYTHEMPYTKDSIHQLFLNTGFKESKCYALNPVPKNIKGKIRSFLWKWKVAHTRFWKMVETGNSSGIFTSNLIAVGKK